MFNTEEFIHTGFYTEDAETALEYIIRIVRPFYLKFSKSSFIDKESFFKKLDVMELLEKGKPFNIYRYGYGFYCGRGFDGEIILSLTSDLLQEFREGTYTPSLYCFEKEKINLFKNFRAKFGKSEKYHSQTLYDMELISGLVEDQERLKQLRGVPLDQFKTSALEFLFQDKEKNREEIRKILYG